MELQSYNKKLAVIVTYLNCNGQNVKILCCCRGLKFPDLSSRVNTVDQK